MGFFLIQIKFVYMKGFVHGLMLKVRVSGTRKWPETTSITTQRLTQNAEIFVRQATLSPALNVSIPG